MLSKEVITQWEICKEKILSGQKRKLSVEEMDFFDKLSSELFNLNFSYRTSSIKKEDFVWFMSIIKEDFPELEKNNHQLLEKFNTLFLSNDEHNDTAHNHLIITYMGYSDMLRTYERLLKLWGDLKYSEIEQEQKQLKIDLSNQRRQKREMHEEFKDIIFALKKEADPVHLGFSSIARMEKEIVQARLHDLVEEINGIVIPKLQW